MLRSLVSGEADGIDFGVTSARFAEYFRELGFGIAISSETVFVTPAFIAVPKTQGVSAEEVDRAFWRLMDSGKISDLSHEFLKRDYTDPLVFTGAEAD